MSEAKRSTWVVKKIRVEDIQEAEVVYLGAAWREVFDVWTSEDDPFQQFGDDSPISSEIAKKFQSLSEDWVIIRYVDTGLSTPSETESALTCRVKWDLVDVQVRED